MSTARQLAWIAGGYVLAVVAGIGCVIIHELLTPAEISQSSGGMVAFGDMIVFVLVAGVVSLVPTWLLLKLTAEAAPRTLLGALVLIAATGPVSWLAVTSPFGAAPMAAGSASALLGLAIVFGALPRIVAGPVVLMAEAAALVLLRARAARTVLAGAMLMDIVPLGLFVLHLTAATLR